MTNDPAVQSVRVAVALLDRFADLLQGPTQMTAVKQKGALVGFSGNQDDFSLRIGEAQQVYPEIWRHLDEARAGFAARGIDVSVFDGIRSLEGQGLGAAPDIQAREYGANPQSIQTHTKTANFNREGFGRARAASIALMRATPQIDWGAIAKAEQHDPVAAAFGREARTRRRMWFVLLAIGLASPFIIILTMQARERARIEALNNPDDPPPAAEPLTGAELDKLRIDVAQQRGILEAVRDAWDRIGTFGGLGAITAGTEPCPMMPSAPPAAASDAFIRTGTEGVELDASAFVAYLKGPADRKLPNRELAEALRAVDYIYPRAKAGTADAADAARLAKLPHRSVIVVIDTSTEPEITQTAPMTYKPGEVIGRGYVFSLDTATVTCAGAISVRNPPTPDPPDLLSRARRSADAKDLLHRQLEIGIRQALSKLSAVQ